MDKDNTNWGQSVTGVVIHKGKVLLARHTYGGGKGKLIIPGGYVEKNWKPKLHDWLFGSWRDEAYEEDYRDYFNSNGNFNGNIRISNKGEKVSVYH